MKYLFTGLKDALALSSIIFEAQLPLEVYEIRVTDSQIDFYITKWQGLTMREWSKRLLQIFPSAKIEEIKRNGISFICKLNIGNLIFIGNIYYYDNGDGIFN